MDGDFHSNYRASFPFIRKDIQLSAVVNPETGKQTLVMEKLNATGGVEFSDSIDCIHTAILTIKENDLQDATDTADAKNQFHEDVVNKKASIDAQSSEDIIEINLEPEEKFNAFKSWVAGIAESGLHAFKIQSEIEEEARLIIPVTRPIMKFLIKIDSSFILDYIRLLEKECIFEGVKHESSLIANLIPVLEIITDKSLEKSSDSHNRTLLKAIFQMNPPLRLFTKEIKFAQLLELPEATEMDQFSDTFRSELPLRKHIILNPKALDFEEYSQFLNYTTEPEYYLRKTAAENPKATKFSQYKNFLSIITEPDSRVRNAAAKNPNASQFDEFSNFLSVTTEPISRIRKTAAKQIDAPSFSQFVNLLSFKTEPDENVRKAAARQIDAIKYKEFTNFLSFKTEPDQGVRATAALNPKAIELKGYQNLASETIEPNPEIREIVKKVVQENHQNSSPISETDFERYNRLKSEFDALKEEFEDDNSEIIVQLEKMRKDLFPPDVVTRMQDDVSRELVRLKQMVKKTQSEKTVELGAKSKKSAKKTKKKTTREPSKELK